MTPISAHFSWEEATVTSHRELDNTPTLVETPHLVLVFNEQMEQLRALFDCPIQVNSAYRSPAVNAAVGGAASSQHMKGQAVDWVPLADGLVLKEAYRRVLESAIVYDQLIYEFGRWIHISRPAFGAAPRRQTLMIGKWTNGAYLPYSADDAP